MLFVALTSRLVLNTLHLYTNCQNRPCGKEFNTTAFVDLLICNVNVNTILWRNLNIVSMKLFPQWLTSLSTSITLKYILLWGNLIQTEPSIGASHQSSAHLAKQFQRRRLLEIGQSETRIVCGDHVCQRIENRPCGKEFNTTAFFNLLICNVNATMGRVR
jgi:hypothetical protein